MAFGQEFAGSDGNKQREQVASLLREGAFLPVVAVLTSYDVDAVCQKNNLTFCELLLPFTQLATEAAIKDPNNQNFIVKNLRVDFRDLRRDGFLTSATLPMVLSDLMRQYSPSPADSTCYLTNQELCTPWYDAYRSQFLRLLEPSDHEFLRHYISCIFVVSTLHDDPLDQLNRLSQAQHYLQHQNQISSFSPNHNPENSSSVQLPKHAATPKWFSPTTFKYHVLIHDMLTGDEKKAEIVYQSMKMTYGAHGCHLLRINSAAPPSDSTSNGASMPDPWSGYLRNRLRHFNNLHIRQENPSATDGLTPTTANGNAIVLQKTSDTSDETMPVEMISEPLSTNDLVCVESQETTVERESQIVVTRHGQCMTSSDIDRVKTFVQEFVVRGLLPYVERQLRILHEQVTARRGLHKTLVNFTRNLWVKTNSGGSAPNLQTMGSGGVSPSGSASSSSTVLNSPERPTAGNAATPAISYSFESAEMQTRRLADLAALFQNYELAYSLYHGLKKDFMAAQANIHAASAVECACLCVFLAGASPSRPVPLYYMEQAITTYISIGMPILATRATVYGAALTSLHNEHGQAAALYIRLSSGEDLRSALFLEQAACCFIRANLHRKAALHLILAGHRYNKAGRRQHTIRCYEAALRSYEGKGWRYALEHVYLTLGRPMQSEDMRQIETDEEVTHAKAQPAIFLPKLDSKAHLADLARSLNEPQTVDASELSKPQVFCSLNCSKSIEHDFVNDGLCRLNIDIEVVADTDVDEVMIRTYTGDSSTNEFQEFYRGYPLLMWANGRRRLTFNEKDCERQQQSQRLQLMALVTVPGIYELSSLKLLFCRRGKDPTVSGNWEEAAALQSQFITVIQRNCTQLETPGIYFSN